MTVLLDGPSKSTHAVISGGGLTVGSTSINDEVARADTSASAGLVVFEVTANFPSLDVASGFGITNASGYTGANLGVPTGVANGAVIINRNGGVEVNGAFFGFVAGLNGQTTMVAMNLNIGRLWFLVDDFTDWNNIVLHGSADPAANLNGIDISAVLAGGPIFPVGVITSFTNSATFNFGALPFVHASRLPSGYGPYDGSAPPSPPPPRARIFARAPAFASIVRAKSAGEPTGIVMRTATIAATEPSDVLTASVGNTVGVTAAVTEPDDVFAADATTLPPANFDDGEVIFVPPEYGFRVPAEPSSPFVIPFEDRVLVVPLLDL